MAILLGEPDGILRLPPAGLRNVHEWTQLDSDILAQFLQVQSQIHHSKWNNSEIRFTTQGDKLLEHQFPEFEHFVFAAVYFRQLIAQRDHLLQDAVTRYRRFVDCPIRSQWIDVELQRFNGLLDGNCFMLPTYTVREVFDAFMYGASLMHKIPEPASPKRQRFLQIYDNEPPHRVLYALNMALKVLMNHVGNAAVVIYRDFSHWLDAYKLPPPDTRWHDRLFQIDTLVKQSASSPASDV